MDNPARSLAEELYEKLFDPLLADPGYQLTATLDELNDWSYYILEEERNNPPLLCPKDLDLWI